jgi:hypothetical protein
LSLDLKTSSFNDDYSLAALAASMGDGIWKPRETLDHLLGHDGSNSSSLIHFLKA